MFRILYKKSLESFRFIEEKSRKPGNVMYITVEMHVNNVIILHIAFMFSERSKTLSIAASHFVMGRVYFQKYILRNIF